MAIRIETDYVDDIVIGTRADDGRLHPTSVYIRTWESSQFMVLTQKQALELAAMLLDTVRKSPH